MAKKGKKFLSLMALAAAAAGTYCYLKKKNSNIPENMEDDDDFDNFDVDVDDGPTSRGTSGKRSYVSLDFNSAKEKVMDVASKVAENDIQKRALGLLIKYYETGDLKIWDEFNIEWVKGLF